MKVLFVSSGNSGKISSIVSAQGKSLEYIGISVSYFLIQGKGIKGYLTNIPKLKKHLIKNDYDVVHAHYSFTAYACSLANVKPLIVSLMGSDVKGSRSVNYILKIFCKYIWNAVIVKSKDMKESICCDYSYIIPNGVNIEKFKPIDKKVSKNILSWNNHKIHLLFAADPDREEKNYKLFEKSVKKLRKTHKNLEIKFLLNVDVDKVPIYMNASDVVCLSSKWEGSPNVIKEAMACNRPIVSTDVGDVRWLFGKISGHFICENHDVEEYFNKILQAISYSNLNQKTKGRERLKELRLHSEQIANRIKEVYKSI